MQDGFNSQWRGYQLLEGTPASAETEIRVKVIIGDLPAPLGGTYSHPQGIVRIPGKLVNGKIVVPAGVLGHEIQHALQFQDGRFSNPDVE